MEGGRPRSALPSLRDVLHEHQLLLPNVLVSPHAATLAPLHSATTPQQQPQPQPQSRPLQPRPPQTPHTPHRPQRCVGRLPVVFGVDDAPAASVLLPQLFAERGVQSLRLVPRLRPVEDAARGSWLPPHVPNAAQHDGPAQGQGQWHTQRAQLSLRRQDDGQGEEDEEEEDEEDEEEEREEEGEEGLAHGQQPPVLIPTSATQPHRMLHCPHSGCDVKYRFRSKMERHVRTHTGEKPHKCTEPGCEMAFAQREGLSRHLRSHNGEKPFACTVPGCNKRFSESGNLKRHVRSHSGERPFRCEWRHCGKRFTSAFHLHRHQETHKGQEGEQ